MLYIVRHGETDWNVAHRVQGKQPNIPLNANGRRQAKELAQKIADLQIDVCLCSPLQRAVETAEIIYGGKIIIDERLTERGFGPLEGEVWGGNKAGAWNIKNPAPVPFESVTEMMTRVKGFLDDIRREYAGKNVLVVTHGGVVRIMRANFKGIPKSGDLYDLPTAENCEVLCYDECGRNYLDKFEYTARPPLNSADTRYNRKRIMKNGKPL
jgi:broad specificity phosphatase PhoE